MGEKLGFEEKRRLADDLRDLKPLERSSRMLEVAFNSNSSSVEEVPTEDNSSVTRLRAFITDPDGGMGYVADAHILAAAQVLNGDHTLYVLEAFYPHASTPYRVFYEFDPDTKQLRTSEDVTDQTSGEEKTADYQEELFPFLCKDLFWNMNFRSVYLYTDTHPFQHPYFKDITVPMFR